MPLPTFVIAGAQKSGTSSLTATLRRHPQIHMSRPKELHFFDRQRDLGLEWYAQQFNPGPGEVQYGEATPTYMYDDDARTAMCESLPEARFVVILRDPAKRAYSHFWHSRRLGFETVETFEEALELEPVRLASGNRSDRMRFSYTDRGYYLRQLLEFERLVGRERMHVMLLDDLTADRVPTLEKLLDFIAVDTEPAATIEEKWTNKYRVADTPGGKKKAVAYPPMPNAIRSHLVDRFKPWNERLGTYLGRDLSAWNA